MKGWKQALLGTAIGVVLSRVGLAGSEGVLRGLDGQEPGLLLLGACAVVLHSVRRDRLLLNWKVALGAGVLLGLGLGLLGAVPTTLAASLGEGRLLAIPLLAVSYAGWRFGARWDPALSERAPAAPPPAGRPGDAPRDSETDSAG